MRYIFTRDIKNILIIQNLVLSVEIFVVDRWIRVDGVGWREGEKREWMVFLQSFVIKRSLKNNRMIRYRREMKIVLFIQYRIFEFGSLNVCCLLYSDKNFLGWFWFRRYSENVSYRKFGQLWELYLNLFIVFGQRCQFFFIWLFFGIVQDIVIFRQMMREIGVYKYRDKYWLRYIIVGNCESLWLLRVG